MGARGRCDVEKTKRNVLIIIKVHEKPVKNCSKSFFLPSWSVLLSTRHRFGTALTSSSAGDVGSQANIPGEGGEKHYF